jgi:hypothetical protein
MSTETNFSKALLAILRQLDTLPKNEREELLHHVQCGLASINRMYAQVLFGDGDDLDGGIAAIRAAGFEATIEHVIDEDDPDAPPTTFVAVTGTSELRDGAFLDWLTALVKPYGGHVHEAGYADPAPRPNTPRPTDH